MLPIAERAHPVSRKAGAQQGEKYEQNEQHGIQIKVRIRNEFVKEVEHGDPVRRENKGKTVFDGEHPLLYKKIRDPRHGGKVRKHAPEHGQNVFFLRF